MSRFNRFKQFNDDEMAVIEEALIHYNKEAMDNDDFYGDPEKNRMMETRRKLMNEYMQRGKEDETS